jgi:hypothetical protein
MLDSPPRSGGCDVRVLFVSDTHIGLDCPARPRVRTVTLPRRTADRRMVAGAGFDHQIPTEPVGGLGLRLRG